jgi:hypothetical protein
MQAQVTIVLRPCLDFMKIFKPFKVHKHPCFYVEYLIKKFNSIFIIKIPFFGYRPKGFHFCYLPNTNFPWNQLKCKSLDNSYCGGDFSNTCM